MRSLETQSLGYWFEIMIYAYSHNLRVWCFRLNHMKFLSYMLKWPNISKSKSFNLMCVYVCVYIYIDICMYVCTYVCNIGWLALAGFQRWRIRCTTDLMTK